MKYALILGFAVASLLPPGLSASSGEQITPLGDVRRGEFVTVQGTVARFVDSDELVLEDSSGRMRIFVWGGIDRRVVSAGDTIVVHGQVDDDLFVFFREIYASRIELSDGTIFEVSSREWN